MSTDVPLTVAAAPPGVTVNLLNPDYNGRRLVIVAIAGAAMSAICTLLRLYTRRLIVRSMGWDDFWIVCAWLNAVALTVGDCLLTNYGGGTHLWNVTINNYNSFLKVEILLGTVYNGALTFAKISICCFYLRLSPPHTFRYVVYIVIAFVASSSVAGFLVLIFSCNPVAASWDLALASLLTTRCIDRPAIYLAMAAINIFTDLIILLLPVHIIWRWPLPTRQKISVGAILAAGLLVCITSMIRLESIVIFRDSTDITWDISDLLIWSTLEAHICIICAALAALQPFATRFFPTLLGEPTLSSSPFPSIPGKGSRLHSGPSLPPDRELFDMLHYRQRAGVGAHRAVVSTNNNNKRSRDMDGSSQESIIGVGDPFAAGDYKDRGVYVTRTVEVS